MNQLVERIEAGPECATCQGRRTVTDRQPYPEDEPCPRCCPSGWHQVYWLQTRDKSATAITDLEALVSELGEALEAITAMQALRFGDATATHLSLSVLCETARATLAKLEKARGKDQEHG